MHRRTRYRRTGEPSVTGPVPVLKADGRSRHGRRRAARKRRGLAASIALGAAMVGVLVTLVTAQGVRSEAAPSTGPDVLAAISCVRGWLAEPAPTMQDGAACFRVDRVHRRFESRLAAEPADATAREQAWAAAAPSPSDVRSAAAVASASPSPSSSPSTSATPSSDPDRQSASTAPTSTPTSSPSSSGRSSSTPTASDTAFASGPNSGPITCQGQSGVTISGRTFSGIGNDQPAITISGCSDVTIEGNDFLNDAEPIYVVNSRNVHIVGNRYRNITGPHARNGSHRGNFTQWENSFGGEISNNVGVGGDTEDVVSIYKSGGISADQPLLIQGNVFRGQGWTSSSGSGMMLGDGGGSHIVARNNTLIDVGQVGIGVPGGSDITVEDNTILGSALPHSNVGIYVWGQGAGCSGIDVSGNRIDFKNASGATSALWNGGNCGSIAGWASNSITSLSLAPLVALLGPLG